MHLGNAISGYTCFNIDEGTSLEEFTCGTASSTAITSMIRGIDPVDGKTQVSILKKAHRRGASVKITDYPAIAIVSRILNGDETFPNIIKYDTHPTFTATTSIVDKAYVDGVAIAGGTDASTANKGISKLSYAPASSTNPISVGDNDPRVPTQSENDALIGTSGTPSSSNKFVTNADTSTTSATSTVVRTLTNGKIDSSFFTTTNVKFTGDGSNGSLIATSTNVVIDLANAKIVTKQYTSISITGTGYVTFINPNSAGTAVIFFSQGNTTLTSSVTPMIDLRGLGADGGATVSTSVGNLSGLIGTNGQVGFWITKAGQAPTSSGFGAGGNTLTETFPLALSNYIDNSLLLVGAGGSSGGVSCSSPGCISGAGGKGGGSFFLTVGGTFTFTTANGISVTGNNGGNASGASGAGGGGAGGSGVCIIKYVLAGTITGSCDSGSAGGGSYTGYTNSGGGGAGATGAGATGAGASGGSGGLGYSLMTLF